MKPSDFGIVGHEFLSLCSPPSEAEYILLLPLPRKSTWGILCGDALAGLPLLVDKHGNEQNGDEENNAKNNNDTGLALGPVVALSKLVEGVLGASGEGHADGGHCEGRFIYEINRTLVEVDELGRNSFCLVAVAN